jgi:hypothetical protein
MTLHRLYFDESGDHTDHALDTPKRRYLALCGLIFEVGAYRQFQEAFDQLKRVWQKLRQRADGETKGWGEVFLG